MFIANGRKKARNIKIENFRGKIAIRFYIYISKKEAGTITPPLTKITNLIFNKAFFPGMCEFHPAKQYLLRKSAFRDRYPKWWLLRFHRMLHS